MDALATKSLKLATYSKKNLMSGVHTVLSPLGWNVFSIRLTLGLAMSIALANGM